MGQLQLVVEGMSCRRCVRAVTSRLRDIPGVETVSANPADSTVQMTGSVRPDDVQDALADIRCSDHLKDSAQEVVDGMTDDSGTTAAGQQST